MKKDTKNPCCKIALEKYISSQDRIHNSLLLKKKTEQNILRVWQSDFENMVYSVKSSSIFGQKFQKKETNSTINLRIALHLKC